MQHRLVGESDADIHPRARVRRRDEQAVVIDPQARIERHAPGLDVVLHIHADLATSLGAVEHERRPAQMHVRQLQQVRELEVAIVDI